MLPVGHVSPRLCGWPVHELSSAFIIKTHGLDLPAASLDLRSWVLVSLPMVSPGARFCWVCAL